MVADEIDNLDWHRLKKWFLGEKRDLPWRENPQPYSVWVSEIMLQQTQVSVVIPYYFRWMERFPTIHHLADAPLDEVIKTWEGLGYYSRARHLHESSCYLVQHFGGKLPSEEAELKKIKGLGPYTIGAILSFAFHQKKAAVDGNVIRVLTRYFGIQEDVSKQAAINQLRAMLQELLPNHEPWVCNEALIELGATVCLRKPSCSQCPLKKSCLGHLQGIAHQLPVKTKKTVSQHLTRAVAVIQCGTQFLVKRGGKGKIMRDLYEFPYFEIDQEFCPKALKREIENHLFLKVIQKKVLPEESHSFTRFNVRLHPVLYQCKEAKSVEEMEWLEQEALKNLAFSSGHRRIFQRILACG